MLYADPGAPILNVIAATDAMGVNDVDAGGWGIAARDVSPQLARQVFKQGKQVGYAVVKLDDQGPGGRRRPDRPLIPTIPLTLLPESLFVEDEWVDVARGRWAFGDHITLGEARVVVLLLDTLCRHVAFHRCKLLSLEDNRPVSGAMAKGRSTAPALNYLCRRRAGRTIAADIRTFLPWIESRRMPADYLSRLLDAEHPGA